VSVIETFVGADDDPLPDGWTVRSGSASIDDDCAELTPGTVCTFGPFHPQGSYAVVRVDFDVLRVTAGQEFRAIAGYKVDNGDYYYAFVRINGTSPPNYTFGIGRHSGGSDAELTHVDDTVSTTAAAITLCFGRTLLMAVFESYGFCTYVDGVENPQGWLTGMGAAGTANAYVKTWSAIEHLDSGKMDCPNCWCICTKENGEKIGLPRRLLMSVTVEGDPHCAECLEQDIGMNMGSGGGCSGVGPEYSTCNAWKSSTNYSGLCIWPDCPGPSIGIPYDCQVCLSCGGDEQDNYQLMLYDNVSHNVFGSSKPKKFVCSPFYLEFEIDGAQWVDSTCGCYVPIPLEIVHVIFTAG